MASLILIAPNHQDTHHHEFVIGGMAGVTATTLARSTFYLPFRHAECLYGADTAADIVYSRWAPRTTADAYRAERWIRENCRRDVLAKTTTDEPHALVGIFDLYFLDGWHRKEKFVESRAGHDAPHHLFELSLAGRRECLDVIAWVEEHCRRGHEIVTINHQRLMVVLDDDHEAVQFKLRWCDHLSAV